MAQVKGVECLGRLEFVELFKIHMDHKAQFERLKTILYIELEVRPESGEMEKVIIKNTLGGHLDLNKFILDHMQKNDGFYVLNKKFWDEWVHYTKSKCTVKDAASRLRIENSKLLDNSDSKKHSRLVLDSNIVVVPPRVWSAFTSWYGPSNEIMRYCIEYPKTTEAKLNKLMKVSLDQKTVLELEIDLIYFRVGLILEDGKEPQ